MNTAAKPSNRRALIAVVAALLLVAAGAFAYFVFSPAPKLAGQGGPMAGLAQGAMAKLAVEPNPPAQPQTQLSDAQGAPLTLASYRGKIVLVNLWATWCAPCRAEMPTLAALQTQFKDRGVVVAAINMDEETKVGEATQMLAELSGGALTFLHVAPGALFSEMQVQGLPTSILYDRNGVEIARLMGSADWGGSDAAAVIEAALAKP